MNAVTRSNNLAPRLGGGIGFDGFRNCLRKDILEWFRTRRALTTLVVATVLLVVGLCGERLRQIVGDTSGPPLNLDPSFNLTHAGWDPLVFLFAAFATMGLLTGERERGTLSWSLSMPLDRPAVLASKFVSALAVFALVAVVIPDAVVAAVAWFAYGSPPSFNSMLWMPLGVYAAAVFVVTLNLAASTFVPSQAAVIGVTMTGAVIVPGFVNALSPSLSRFLPSFIQDSVTSFGAGKPVDIVTPVVWAASIVLLLTVATVRLRRAEL